MVCFKCTFLNLDQKSNKITGLYIYIYHEDMIVQIILKKGRNKISGISETSEEDFDLSEEK